ncbi:hypothetical protein JCM11641_000108 [Rhodosporidiobolus odoratus]
MIALSPSFCPRAVLAVICASGAILLPNQSAIRSDLLRTDQSHKDATLERTPHNAGVGASVLAGVRALEAQKQNAAGSDEATAPPKARETLDQERRAERRLPGGNGVQGRGQAEEGDAKSIDSFIPKTARPQPVSASSAPILPSSGLVASRRQSWIDLADGVYSGDRQLRSRGFTDEPSTTASSAGSLPSSPASRPASPFSAFTAPRSLSSAALAAVADTPPRPRPPLPSKSSARLSRASSRMSAYSDTASPDDVQSRSSSANAAIRTYSSVGSPLSVPATQPPLQHVLRKVPSLATTPPASSSHDYPPHSVATSRPSSLAIASPAALHLSQPRSRSGAGPARTPALSQAGSTGSSRPSSGAFSPRFEQDRNSFFSFEGAHGHGEDSTGNASDYAKSATATPATTAEFTPDRSPQISYAGDSPSMTAKKRLSKPPGLHLDPASSAPPDRTSALRQDSHSLQGLGIDLAPPSPGGRPSFDGEGDFGANLDRLSMFAASLPSPLSPATAYADSPPGVPGFGSRAWGLQHLTVQSEAGGTTLQDDRTLVLPPRTHEPTAPPVPESFARLPRQREESATSTMTSTTTSSLSSATSHRPSHLSLPRPRLSHRALRSPPSLDRLSTKHLSESEACLSPEETDYLSTDDEDSFNLLRRGGRRFLGFGDLGRAGERSSGTPDTSFVAGSSLKGSSVYLNSGATSSELWNEDVPTIPFLPGESGLQFVMNAPAEDVVNWSDKAIEKKELPAETTHLILARCKTPFQIAPLLTLTVPLLTHGLVVLDIGDCGLSEVPSAIASCCFLEELDIRGNQLATQTLPSFLGTLPALHVLLADNCNLSSLPNSLSQLSRLHTLTLRNNRFRFLPSWLCRLDALEALLVDGNPFHFQIHHLVRPLFVEGAIKLENGVDSAPTSRGASPAPPSRAMSPLPHGPFRTLSSPTTLPDSPGLSETASPPLSSPHFARSSSATPIYSAFSTPPSHATLAHQLQVAQTEIERDRHASESAILAESPTSPALSPPLKSPSTLSLPVTAASSVLNLSTEGKEEKEKKKWAKKLMKKVSGARIRGGSQSRPGALDADSRAYSQPVTQGEESVAEEKATSKFGSFGRKKKSSKRPVLALQGQRNAPVTKRRSFLMLDAFASPKASTGGELPSPTPHDHAAALRSVLAYLRDLDDLSPDVTLPTIPLETPGSRLRHSPSLDSTKPSLRHSPSLGAISGSSPRPSSPAQMRRAQSTRRLPPTFRPDSGRFSQFYDDAESDGRSPTPLASSTSQSKLVDDPVKREAVLKEIIETEQSYLRGLEELCGIYVASASMPISTSGTGKKDSVLPAAERRAVFSNIEAIRDFHRKILLPDLLAAVRSGGESVEVAEKVGEVFVNHASFLKIYSSYINGFDDALTRIQTWAKSSSSRSSTSNGTQASPSLAPSTFFDASAGVASSLSSSQKKRIKNWMKRCRAHPSHSQISLESYLLLPIQRIPRYRLLLESLSTCTPAPRDSAPISSYLDPTSPSYSPASSVRLDRHPVIALAGEEIDAVAVILNESKRENEGRAQLLNWQNRIQQKFKSSLVQPHRTSLRSGNLTIIRSVKRATTVEAPSPTLYRRPQQNNDAELFTLFQENKQIELIALLCTDLLVLCRAPPPPLDTDPNAPVELYTVLRLNRSSGKGEPPASLFGAGEDMLRVRVGDKAIVYLQCGEPANPKTRRNAVEWMNAINLQWEVNS